MDLGLILRVRGLLRVHMGPASDWRERSTLGMRKSTGQQHRSLLERFEDIAQLDPAHSGLERCLRRRVRRRSRVRRLDHRRASLQHVSPF